MRKFNFFVLLFIFAASALAQNGREPGFKKWALTPPMGWNSWDCYGPSVIEEQVKANTDYMALHLKDYGWEYIVVDIRWYVDNQKGGPYNDFAKSDFIIDEYGRYMPSPSRFPSSANGAGMKPLADYVHSKGFKFGIHIMRGIPVTAVNKKLPIKGTNKTAADIYSTDLQCTWLRDNYTILADKEGAQEYYNSIFELYASWGVDFIKVDDLARPYHENEINLIRNAIDRTGRPIVLSMSPGATPVAKAGHAMTHANMWRTVDDFWDRWPLLSNQFEVSRQWTPYITPGAWPDADMLPLGQLEIYNDGATGRWTKFSKAEQYSMMTLWTIFKSPLIFGGNMPQNDEFTNSLLTNREVLEMHHYSLNNKEWLNKEGKVAWTADDPFNGDKYLALFNNGDDGFIDPTCIAYKSGKITRSASSHGVKIDIPVPSGTKELYLIINDGGDGTENDLADWINPTLYKANGDSVKLTDLNWELATPGRNRTIKNKNSGGGSLIINGKTFENGIGTQSRSIILFHLPESVVRFKTFAGIDKSALEKPSGGTIEAMVAFIEPRVKSFDFSNVIAHTGRISKTMQRGGTNLTADIIGAKKLYLVVSEAGDNNFYDHANWINPAIYKPNGDSLLLTSLRSSSISGNSGAVQINRSFDGKPLTVNGKVYENGFGTSSPSLLEFDIPAGYTRFSAFCGLDDEIMNFNIGTTVEFLVFTKNPMNSAKSAFPVNLADLGFNGSATLRNLWTHSDTSISAGSNFSPLIEHHGANLYRISAQGREESAKIKISVLKPRVSAADSVYFTAIVSLPETLTSEAVGTIVFRQNGELVGIVPADKNGTAQFVASGLKPGSYSFIAHYSGNTSYAPKGSKKIKVKVN